MRAMQANPSLAGRGLARPHHARQARGHMRPTLASSSTLASPPLQQQPAAPNPDAQLAAEAPSSSSSSGSAAGDARAAAAEPRGAAGTSMLRAGLARGGSFRSIQLPPSGIVTAALMNRVVGAQSSSSEEDHYRSDNRVAYQGVPGAYSEGAALKACPGWEPLPCEQFEVAFQALSQWMAERAVLPVENSLGGSIHAVYDLLLRYRLHIVGEVSVEVNHCLMALPGTKKADLKRVMSHPQALSQVENYLRRLPGVVKEAVDDTAGAAKTIQEQQLQNVGAVASRRAAELYGLEILEENIQDMADNITRFVVLSRDPLVTTGLPEGQRFKTSIVFSLQEGPGQLFKAMSVFALRDINLTKIESRPMRANPIIVSEATGAEGGGRAFNYLFYIDFAGSLADQQSQNALRHLQEIAPFLRVLGSYPADKEL